jgi:hypothetical protein
MTLKNLELSCLLSKCDEKGIVLYAINLFLNSELRVPEKSLNRMFEAIPGYQHVYVRLIVDKEKDMQAIINEA